MTTSHARASSAASVTLAYVESLTSRFESAERHINEDITQIEKRLGQLVELLKAVTTMQQQISSQSASAAELRATVAAMQQQLQRIMDGVEARHAAHAAVMAKKISEASHDQSASGRKVETRVATLENTLTTWLNRGIGMWGVFTLVVGFFQYIGFQYVGGLIKEKDAAVEAVAVNVKRMNELETRQRSLETAINTQRQN